MVPAYGFAPAKGWLRRDSGQEGPAKRCTRTDRQVSCTHRTHLQLQRLDPARTASCSDMGSPALAGQKNPHFVAQRCRSELQEFRKGLGERARARTLLQPSAVAFTDAKRHHCPSQLAETTVRVGVQRHRTLPCACPTFLPLGGQEASPEVQDGQVLLLPSSSTQQPTKDARCNYAYEHCSIKQARVAGLGAWFSKLNRSGSGWLARRCGQLPAGREMACTSPHFPQLPPNARQATWILDGRFEMPGIAMSTPEAA